VLDAAPPVAEQIAHSHHGSGAPILAVAAAIMLAIVFLNLLAWIGS